MKLKYILIILFLYSSQFIVAQDDSLHIGIHQLENNLFRSKGDSVIQQQQPSWTIPSPLLRTKKLDISRKVFGWHPYWASATAYQTYDYEVLSHIAYFSYETDTVTGGYKTINGWDQTPIIDYAHQRGVKVVLTVTNFGTASNTAILKDTLRQIKMIQTLISLLKSRNGDGVNFDFELVSLTYRSNLVAFIKRAVKSIKAEIPGAEISMASPAVDWSGSWDLPLLANLCDYLIVMGYDYYWSSSPTAGPVSPLEGESYNITKTVDTYLNAGVPPQKLMLGTPWFGYNWPVVSINRKASATGSATSVTCVKAEALSLSYIKSFDQTTKVPWFSYRDVSTNTYRQIWYDDALSYSYKYDLVINRNLAGIGIWALSYESGDVNIWKGIQSAFSTTGINNQSQKQTTLNELSLFPNPVRGIAEIKFSLSEQQRVELKVMDLTGKLILTLINKELIKDNYTIYLDCSQLKNALYLLVFKTNSGNLTRKFVVENN